MNTKESNEFQYHNAYGDLLHMPHPLVYLLRFSLEKTSLNLGSLC